MQLPVSTCNSRQINQCSLKLRWNDGSKNLTHVLAQKPGLTPGYCTYPIHVRSNTTAAEATLHVLYLFYISSPKMPGGKCSFKLKENREKRFIPALVPCWYNFANRIVAKNHIPVPSSSNTGTEWNFSRTPTYKGVCTTTIMARPNL